MSEYLRNNGYTVRVFNLINPENSDSWNCLNEIEGQEIMAQLFSDVIIKNTTSGKGDDFWESATRSHTNTTPQEQTLRA
jgi:type IV secretion system protein VirD4